MSPCRGITRARLLSTQIQRVTTTAVLTQESPRQTRALKAAAGTTAQSWTFWRPTSLLFRVRARIMDLPFVSFFLLPNSEREREHARARERARARAREREREREGRECVGGHIASSLYPFSMLFHPSWLRRCGIAVFPFMLTDVRFLYVICCVIKLITVIF